MRPMKAPTPEKMPTTPTLMVSPLLAPENPALLAAVVAVLSPVATALSFFFLDEQAARKLPPRVVTATPDRPAFPAHRMKWRREISELTCRSTKSRSWSGVIDASTSVDVVQTLERVR